MRSGRSARNSNSFSKSGYFFQSPGMGSSSGRSSSITRSNASRNHSGSPGERRSPPPREAAGCTPSWGGDPPPDYPCPPRAVRKQPVELSLLKFALLLQHRHRELRRDDQLCRSKDPGDVPEDCLRHRLDERGDAKMGLVLAEGLGPAFASGTCTCPSFPPGVRSMPFLRMYTKLAMEYWYTRSRTLRTSMRKYISAPRAAGRYTSRIWLMFACVCFASSPSQQSPSRCVWSPRGSR